MNNFVFFQQFEFLLVALNYCKRIGECRLPGSGHCRSQNAILILTLIHVIMYGSLSAIAEQDGPNLDKRRFRAIRSDGFIEFDAGNPVKLAGVTMRSVLETKEPDLLDHVNDIVVREDPEVEVEYLGACAFVYYRQRIYHLADGPGIGHLLTRLKPPHRGTVAELLIAMGAARYDRDSCEMTESMRKRCELVEEKAESAMWGGFRARPLSEYEGESLRELYTAKHGYRVRITAGDAKTRDENIHAADRRLKELGFVPNKLGLLSSNNGVAPLTNDAIPALIIALKDSNRAVRRYGVIGLRNLRADNDQAVSALRFARNDVDEYVRQCAGEALRQIDGGTK